MKVVAKALPVALSFSILLCISTMHTMAQNMSADSSTKNIGAASNEAGSNSSVQGESPVTKAYIEGGVAFGSYEGAGGAFGGKLVLNNKWILGITFTGMSMKPKNKPSDYIPETGIAVIFAYSSEPSVDMSFLSFTGGRCFTLSRTVFANLGGGISFVSGDKVTYTPQQQVTTGFFPAVNVSSNYSSSKEKTSTIGLALDADINWAFASFMGLGLGAHSNLNSIQSPVWFDLKLLVGKMGRPKKHAQVKR
jgi:hypothetical protein